MSRDGEAKRQRDSREEKIRERDGAPERRIKSDGGRPYKGKERKGGKRKSLQRQINSQHLCGVGGGEREQRQGREG